MSEISLNRRTIPDGLHRTAQKLISIAEGSFPGTAEFTQIVGLALALEMWADQLEEEGFSPYGCRQ